MSANGIRQTVLLVRIQNNASDFLHAVAHVSTNMSLENATGDSSSA